ncbi:MAG: hypothetical protein RL701_1430 [Pseudomonadota bacterium]
MSPNALRLLDEALQLGEQDRADLKIRLLDSVADVPASEVEHAWIVEAKCRLAADTHGELNAVAWPEARTRIFGR